MLRYTLYIYTTLRKPFATYAKGMGSAWVLLVVMGLVLWSCSTTVHLPEDEVLYTGVREIRYDDKRKEENDSTSEGVIKALDDAYKAVERVLKGEGDEGQREAVTIEEMTRAQRDSLEADEELQRQALEVAQQEVEAVLSIAPNNSFLGSAYHRFPLPIGLWFYNGFVEKQRPFGKWVFNTFSATPKYISTVNPSLRAKVATNVLHNYGYFRGEVDYEVMPERNPRKAKVAYRVRPHQLFRLDSIAYIGFPPVADSLIRQSMGETLLHKGNAFTARSLDGERTRLNTLLRNNGFFHCQNNFFTYLADTLQRDNWVQLQVRPSRELPKVAGQQFHLRHTVLHLIDTRQGMLPNDTLSDGAVSMRFASVGRHRRPPVKFDVMRRYVFYRKGDLYRQRLVDLMQEKMHGLGVFSQVSMEYTPIDTTARCDSLDVDIFAVMDKPYDAEFRAHAKTKSNRLVGPGVSFGMTKRNAFRGAESLNFQVYGNYEWQTGSDVQGQSSLLNSYEYGTSLSLDYPYIKLGRLARKWTSRAISSTSFKLEADWMNRSGYFGRVSFGARVVLNYQRRRYVKHELTPFRLDYEVQLHSTAAFDSLMRENQALAVSMRNQFVPSLQYVLSMTSRRNARNPRTFTLTLKEAGNVVSGVYAAFGHPMTERDKHLFGVPFAQFFKATAEFTETYKLGSSRATLAGRVLMGAVYSYGNASIAPYNDLFMIGGANSIRAFAARSIGPGSYHPVNSRYSYVDQMGDLKFEANLECRFPLVGSLEGAVFLDCGNVWLMRNNESHPGGAFRLRSFGRELALGTGVGFRYDLDFLVIRFDLGIGIHAPYDTGRKGYYNMPKFGESLGYHLAIGYPF